MKCFACNKRIQHGGGLAITADGQLVNVGMECFNRIQKAKAAGYQPPLGGPRLYRVLAINGGHSFEKRDK